MADVIQADRRAMAAAYMDKSPNYAASILLGELDDTPLLQAFARHRLAQSHEGLREALKQAYLQGYSDGENDGLDPMQSSRASEAWRYRQDRLMVAALQAYEAFQA